MRTHLGSRGIQEIDLMHVTLEPMWQACDAVEAYLTPNPGFNWTTTLA